MSEPWMKFYPRDWRGIKQEDRDMGAEWPSLDDVSLSLTRAAFSPMTAEEFGAYVRLAWSLACQSVNTYSDADPNPSLPEDNDRLARLSWCTPSEWRRVRAAVMANFQLRAGRWYPVDETIIRLSRRPTRNAIPAAIKAQALGRTGQRCAYCGNQDGPFHFDHLFPVAKGGTEDAHNIVVACAPCNLSKSDRTITEWVAALRAGAE